MTGSDRTSVYVGLGSNIGRREEHLQDAVDRLQSRPGIRIVRVSPVYETAAHTLTDEDQPAYLNAVAELETALAPDELLRACQEIERAAGRDRRAEGRWTSRTLDIDILVFGRETIEREGITIPHPRMAARKFVLQPLVDLTSDLWIPPPHQATAAELLDACRDESSVTKTALMIRPR